VEFRAVHGEKSNTGANAERLPRSLLLSSLRHLLLILLAATFVSVV
jgi:hypothetical protein